MGKRVGVRLRGGRTEHACRTFGRRASPYRGIHADGLLVELLDACTFAAPTLKDMQAFTRPDRVSGGRGAVPTG